MATVSQDVKIIQDSKAKAHVKKKSDAKLELDLTAPEFMLTSTFTAASTSAAKSSTISSATSTAASTPASTPASTATSIPAPNDSSWMKSGDEAAFLRQKLPLVQIESASQKPMVPIKIHYHNSDPKAPIKEMLLSKQRLEYTSVIGWYPVLDIYFNTDVVLSAKTLISKLAENTQNAQNTQNVQAFQMALEKYLRNICELFPLFRLKTVAQYDSIAVYDEGLSGFLTPGQYQCLSYMPSLHVQGKCQEQETQFFTHYGIPDFILASIKKLAPAKKLTFREEALYKKIKEVTTESCKELQEEVRRLDVVAQKTTYHLPRDCAGGWYTSDMIFELALALMCRGLSGKAYVIFSSIPINNTYYAIGQYQAGHLILKQRVPDKPIADRRFWAEAIKHLLNSTTKGFREGLEELIRYSGHLNFIIPNPELLKDPRSQDNVLVLADLVYSENQLVIDADNQVEQLQDKNRRLRAWVKKLEADLQLLKSQKQEPQKEEFSSKGNGPILLSAKLSVKPQEFLPSSKANIISNPSAKNKPSENGKLASTATSAAK